VLLGNAYKNKRQPEVIVTLEQHNKILNNWNIAAFEYR